MRYRTRKPSMLDVIVLAICLLTLLRQCAAQ
jgi:hypothetical protein